MPTLQPLQELTRTPNDTSMNELLDEDLGSAVIRRETLPQNALNNSEEWGDIGDPFHTQDKSMTNEAESVIVAEDRKSTRLNSSHSGESRMPSSA